MYTPVFVEDFYGTTVFLDVDHELKLFFFMLTGPPKAITVEDSFKSMCTTNDIEVLLDVLVPDLLARLYEDF